MTVSEFLREVRRIVVDFVVGHVLPHDGPDGGNAEETTGRDDITTYYLAYRKDFGLEDAPVGACILHALSCNLSDSDLADRFDILARSDRTPPRRPGRRGRRLRNRRRGCRIRRRRLGTAGKGSKVPLIDQAHRLTHLWRAGDQAKVDDYLEASGLKRHTPFAKLLQALIELSPAGSEERSILESL